MEGQISIFDIMPPIKIEEIPQISLFKNVKYIGETKEGFKKDAYYRGYYKIGRHMFGDKSIYVEFNVHIITGKNRNGKTEGYVLMQMYRSISELLDNWDIPELKEWISKQTREIEGYFKR